MSKYIIGNWKSNKNIAEVHEWVEKVKAAKLSFTSPKLQVVLCPSFMHVVLVKNLMPDLTLGVQTLSSYPNGAYTGAVSAQIAKEFVQFAILGHVERRKHFGETEQVVSRQVIQALENGITPILAVDDHSWSSQLSQFSTDQLTKMLVMYEPPEAISSNTSAKAADLTQVKQAIQLIKSRYAVMGCLYGGSVNSENIHDYIQEPEIDGVVPGAASLNHQEFINMVKAVG